MKKLFLALLSLVVACGTMAAVYAAETTPSKTTEDLNAAVAEVEVATSVKSASDKETYKAAATVANAELEKLAEVESVEAYFGETEIVLSEYFEEAEVEVKEFMPLVIEGYKDTMGDLTISQKFSTVYEENEKVVVMIGLVDAEGTVVWTAIEALGTANGGIAYVIPAKVAAAMQTNTAILSVIAKA